MSRFYDGENAIHGSLGLFDPCGAECHYIDVIEPRFDTRRRYFGSSTRVVWNGASANGVEPGGERLNNGGQFVEPALNCNLAVYHFDYQNGTIQQWTRNAISGENVGMNWEVPATSFITDVWDQGQINIIPTGPDDDDLQSDPYSWKMIGFQSYGGEVAFYCQQFGNYGAPGDPRPPNSYPARIQVRDFGDGTLLKNAELWGKFPIYDNNGKIGDFYDTYIPLDYLPYDEGNGALVVIESNWRDPPRNNLTGVVNVAFNPSGVATKPNAENDPGNPEIRAFMEPDLDCRSGQTRTFLNRAGFSGLGGARPTLARVDGVWGWGIGSADWTEPQQGDGGAYQRMKTGHRFSAGACGWGFVGLNHEEVGLPIAIPGDSFTLGMQSSAYCDRIYHVPQWQNQFGFVRYDPVADTTELIPIGGGPGDNMMVVLDTWPLLDGSSPENTCEVRCGDTDGDGAPFPDCCGGLDVAVELEQLQFYSDCFGPWQGDCEDIQGQIDPDQFNECVKWKATVTLLESGCPGDCLTGIGADASAGEFATGACSGPEVCVDSTNISCNTAEIYFTVKRGEFNRFSCAQPCATITIRFNTNNCGASQRFNDAWRGDPGICV